MLGLSERGRMLRFSRYTSAIAAIAILVSSALLAACGSGSPQSTPPLMRPSSNAGTPDAADEAAARAAIILYHHIYGQATTAHSHTLSLARFGPLVYWGGPVLSTVENDPVYVNCKNPISCFGNVELFLTRLQHSNMIHIVDQYMEPNRITSNNRYQAGEAMKITYPLPGALPYTAPSGPTALAIVHHVAVAEGAGLRHIYHILFPQGVQICAQPGFCAPQQYCADHGAVFFPDIGIVLTNLEVYQNDVCAARHFGSTPHTLIDATANALSHEIFETITDPYAQLSFQPQYGQYAWLDSTQSFEIGDLCQDVVAPANLAGKTYKIQPEYSNAAAACVYSP